MKKLNIFCICVVLICSFILICQEKNDEMIIKEEILLNNSDSLAVNFSDRYVTGESIDYYFIDEVDCYFENNTLYYVKNSILYELLSVEENRFILNITAYKQLGSEELERPLSNFTMVLPEICSSHFSLDTILSSLMSNSSEFYSVLMDYSYV